MLAGNNATRVVRGGRQCPWCRILASTKLQWHNHAGLWKDKGLVKEAGRRRSAPTIFNRLYLVGLSDNGLSRFMHWKIIYQMKSMNWRQRYNQKHAHLKVNNMYCGTYIQIELPPIELVNDSSGFALKWCHLTPAYMLKIFKQYIFHPKCFILSDISSHIFYFLWKFLRHSSHSNKILFTSNALYSQN